VVLAGLERGCKGNTVACWEAQQTVLVDLATGHHSARKEAPLIGTFDSAMHHCLLENWDPAIDNLGKAVDHDLSIELFANLVVLLVEVENFGTVLSARVEEDHLILADPARIEEHQIKQEVHPRIVELQIRLEVLAMIVGLQGIYSLKHLAILLGTYLQTKPVQGHFFQLQECGGPDSFDGHSSD
jgi:hypothetical protein